MKKDSLIGDIGELTVGGLGIGMGATMISSMASAGISSGFTKFASFYPTMSTATVMKHTLGKLQDLNKKVKGGER